MQKYSLKMTGILLIISYSPDLSCELEPIKPTVSLFATLENEHNESFLFFKTEHTDNIDEKNVGVLSFC